MIAEQPMTLEQACIPETDLNAPIIQKSPMLEATDKENTINLIADAGKASVAKQLGEQSCENAGFPEGLAPKDVNVQPIEMA